MADLFDMNVPGLGWHGLVAFIALAALIVACFAQTGYISGNRHHPSLADMQKELDDVYYQLGDELNVSKIVNTGETVNTGVTKGHRQDHVAVTATASTRVITEASGTRFYITMPAAAVQMNFILPAPQFGATYEFYLAGTTGSTIAVYPHTAASTITTSGATTACLANSLQLVANENGTFTRVSSAAGDAVANGPGGIELDATAVANDYMKFMCVSESTAAPTLALPLWVGEGFTLAATSIGPT